MTLKQVRARFRNGVLEPLDDLGLSEDEEVLVTVEATDSVCATQPSESVPRTLPDMYEDPEGFIEAIYQARLDGTRTRPRTI